MLSGRGLCNELITRPEESYRLWCVVVCDLETTKILVIEEEAKAHQEAIAPRRKKGYHTDSNSEGGRGVTLCGHFLTCCGIVLNSRCRAPMMAFLFLTWGVIGSCLD